MAASLIDEFLPDYEFATHHSIEIDASVEDVYAVVRDLDLSNARLARVLLWIRNVPARLKGEQGLGLTLDDLLDLGFILLAEEPPRELVLGFAGELWTASGNLRRLQPDAFLPFAESGCVKAVMNFTIQRLQGGRSRLATDSRALCLDETSRQRFRRYMFFTDRLRGVLRRSLLRECRRRAEARSRLPRD